MKKLFTILLLGAFVLFFEGCKKDEEPNNDQRTELLTSKSWKMTGYTENGEDTLDEWLACELDNITTFYADGTFEEDEGETKCDENDPQTAYEGTWRIEENNLIMTFPESLIALNMTIVELNTTTLRISGSLMGSTTVITFTAQ